ncbi:hypothetical protein DOE63_03005 [Salmonella enterica subsp. diarizonae serovar 59:z10:-]|nr:hypothetical protein DOE63_03005 [Salmonella enterica subsp. diarizonae serovar 59:z10:-]
MKTDTDGLTMNQLAERNAEHVTTIAALESRCAALAAEGAKLKNPDNWLSQNDYGYEAAEVAAQNGATNDESLRAGMIAIINRIETPATDAFLAEVRASAIEAFADNQEKIADEELVGGNLDLSLRFRGMARAAKEFAAQIRQESAK